MPAPSLQAALHMMHSCSAARHASGTAWLQTDPQLTPTWFQGPRLVSHGCAVPVLSSITSLHGERGRRLASRIKRLHTREDGAAAGSCHRLVQRQAIAMFVVHRRGR